MKNKRSLITKDQFEKDKPYLVIRKGYCLDKDICYYSRLPHMCNLGVLCPVGNDNHFEYMPIKKLLEELREQS